MLRRVYIDNFACFINFELRLEPLMLFAGANGSGKSTLMDLVSDMPGIALASVPVATIFGHETRNRWQTRTDQIVELELTSADALYVYRIKVDQTSDGDACGIVEERLTSDGQVLFEYRDGEARVFPDDGSSPSRFPTAPRTSALSLVGDGRPEFARVANFKELLSSVGMLKPDPDGIEPETRREAEFLVNDLSNFASWYRFVLQSDTRASHTMTEELADVLPGFAGLKFRTEGRSKTLVAQMDGPGGVRDFDLDELSSGQRLLIALYASLHFDTGWTTCCFWDEPDNFLAVREIEPWIRRLIDQVEEGPRQVIIASHHPLLLDLLPITRFWREQNGPVRAAKFQLAEGETLAPSEVMARGWDDD